MSNYAFTGILDKLPHRWPNFTTGEKRLVTVLRYKSLLVTLYFFFFLPIQLFLQRFISPLFLFLFLPLPPFSSAPSRSSDSLPRQSRARAKKKCVALSKPIFLFFSLSLSLRKKEEEKKNDIPFPPHKENRVNLLRRGFSPLSPSPQPCPASTLQPN